MNWNYMPLEKNIYNQHYHVKYGLKPIFGQQVILKPQKQNNDNFSNPTEKLIKQIIKLQKRYRRNLYQQRKIKELYETEKKYIQALELLDTTIQNFGQQYLTNEQNQMIFGQVKSLLMLHKNSFLPLFQENIEKRLSIKSLFDQLPLLIHGLNQYKIYSYNYKNTEKLIQKFKQEKHQFYIKIQQFENTSEFCYYDFPYLIYYPIARIFHYKNTFQDMVKHKSYLEWNFIETRRIYKSIEQITSGIDEQLEDVDYSNQLYMLSKKLNMPALFQQHRKVEYQTQIQLVDGFTLTPFEFYLITDQILIHDKWMKNLQILNLDHNSYCKLLRDWRQVKNMIIIFGINQCLFLATQSKDEQESIFIKIQKIIYNLSKKNQMRNSLKNQTPIDYLMNQLTQKISQQNNNTSQQSKLNEEQDEFQTIIQFNQQNIFVEPIARNFRCERTIYIFQVIKQFNKQLLFLSFTQIEKLIDQLQNNYQNLQIPKQGLNTKDDQRLLKLCFFLSYILNHSEIQQDPKKIMKILGLNIHFYQDSEKKQTISQFWNKVLLDRIQDPLSVQNLILQEMEKQQRIYSNYTSAPRENRIIINLINNTQLKIAINESTLVIHVLFDIATALNMVSFLDFGLFIKLNNEKQLLQQDYDNKISKLLYDYSQVSMEFFFLKALYLPIQSELIDAAIDSVRKNLFYQQLMKDILELNMTTSNEVFYHLAAGQIYILFLKDRSINVKDFLQKNQLISILPMQYLSKSNLNKTIEGIQLYIEVIHSKYQNKEDLEIIEQINKQEKKGKLDKLISFFKKQETLEIKEIKDEIIQKVERTRSKSLEDHLKNSENLVNPKDNILINKIQYEMISLFDKINNYGSHFFNYKIEESELPQSFQNEAVILDISYNNFKLIQKKNNQTLLEYSIQKIIQVFDQDNNLMVKIQFQILYSNNKDKELMLQLKNIKEKTNINIIVIKKIEEYLTLNLINQ